MDIVTLRKGHDDIWKLFSEKGHIVFARRFPNEEAAREYTSKYISAWNWILKVECNHETTNENSSTTKTNR